MKKITLGTLLLTCPWMVFAHNDVKRQNQSQQAPHAGQTIEDLRAQCEGFRNDNQIKEFSIDIACKGNYSYWEKESGYFSLRNDGNMSFHTSTKGGRFETQPGNSSGARQSEGGSCSIYSKRRMSTEGLSLTIDSITDCADLTVENIYRLCEGEVHDYCDGNFVLDTDVNKGQAQQQSQQQQQQRNDGKCVLSTVEVNNTCLSYN